MSEEKQIILPDGFTRVAYLESSGTQYIDTEYVPDNETGIWIKADPMESTNNYLMGLNNTTDWNSNQRIYIRNSTTQLYGWGAYMTSSNVNAYGYIGSTAQLNFLNDRYAIHVVNGTDYTSQSLTKLSFTPSHSLYIFAVNFGGSPSTCISKLKVYEAKISQGTEVVRDFIPCIDSDGVPCMYDLITQTAYYNEGSGVFEFEEYVEEEEENTHVDLPNGYTKLDYLYSEGNQYIDTGYVPTNETGLYIDCQSYWSKFSFPMGVMESSSTGRLYSHRTSSTSGENKFGWNDKTIIWTSKLKLTHERYESRVNFYNSKIAKIDINDLTLYSTLSDELPTMSKSIYLFTINVGGSLPNSVWNTTENGHCGKVFRAKISQGDTVVRDYVPALDPDGVPCMFEVFTGEAYYNQGTGKFLTPLDFERTKIPSNYKTVSYLECEEQQYIDTEYIPNNEMGMWISCERSIHDKTNSIPFGVTNGDYIYPPRINGSDGYMVWAWNTYKSPFKTVIDDYKYKSDINFLNSRKVNFKSDSREWTENISATLKTIAQPLWLFSYNVKGAFSDTYSKWKGKIYRAKISQLDIVVRHYIPCLDTDDVPCMYDLVTQTAYYNKGECQFTTIYDTNPHTGFSTLGIISDRLGVGDMDENLIKQIPNNYTRLKFLKSNGNEYIDTEYYATDRTGLYCDNWTTDVSNSQFAMGYYSTTNIITNGNIQFYCPRANLYCGHGYSTENDKTSALSAYKGKRIVSYLNFRNSKVATYDFIDADAKFEYALGTYSISMKYPIYMFSSQNNGVANYKFRGKIYRAKITEGDMLVRDYVPCLDGDGIPCMYDMIQGKTYYNKGTGAFSYE